MSIHNLGFRILGFYHRVQWRGAKTGGKECWGACHGLIPSLWDFAQNCSLQIERWNQNWRGTSYSLDSEKASIEPCISAVSWAGHSFSPSPNIKLPEWKAEKVEFKMPTCGKIAVWQLCRERQPVWNSHDGLNLTHLDQCHGVRSHGTSSSQGWRKRLVIQQSEFDPWVHILVFAEGDCCRFAWESLPVEIGKSRHWTPVFFCRCASSARFAQGQPKKEFHRTTKAKWMLIERWRRPSMLSSMCQHVARLQFDSCAGKDSLSGTVMMAWIWHVWINAMVFVGWRQRIVKVYSLNLIDEFTSLFSPKVIVAGLRRKAFPQEAGLCGHQCFSVVAQATAKIRPRPAQGFFSDERTW